MKACYKNRHINSSSGTLAEWNRILVRNPGPDSNLPILCINGIWCLSEILFRPAQVSIKLFIQEVSGPSSFLMVFFWGGAGEGGLLNIKGQMTITKIDAIWISWGLNRSV